MRLPSGDQTGWLSRQLPVVSSRVRTPSTSTIQMLLARSSLTLSTHDRVKTISLPSGEISGLETLSMFMKVSLSRVPDGPFLDWANAPRHSETRNSAVKLERRSFEVMSLVPPKATLWETRLSLLLSSGYLNVCPLYSTAARQHYCVGGVRVKPSKLRPAHSATLSCRLQRVTCGAVMPGDSNRSEAGAQLLVAPT